MGVVRNKLQKIKDMNSFKFLSLFTLFIILLTSNVYSKPTKDKDEGTPQINTDQTKDISNSTNECPHGWHLIQDTCYLFNKTILNFQNAQKWCKDQNSTLFEPKDNQTNNMVFNNGKIIIESEKWKTENHTQVFFWVGIHDSDKEGNFTYLSNEQPMQFFNWSTGEPNDFGNGEDCVYVYENGSWNDANCTHEYESICEKPKIEKETSTSESTATSQNSNKLPVEDSVITQQQNTTSKPEEQSTTPTPSPHSDCSSNSGRKYDGLSFFGGMVFTIATALISFFGIKIYKNRKARTENYNTFR